MNPLTQIRNTQKATKREIEAGIHDTASWHAQYKHSAYIFSGGLDYDLTEGDLLAVFSQFGEVVDINLVRHKDTGKSKGFAFVAYEDQRSTILAVDNLNGAKVVGRTIRVEHVDNYKKRKAEMEGEDPNAVSEDAEEYRAAEQATGRRIESMERQDGAGPHRNARSPSRVDRQQPPSLEPWAGAGSIFALMEEAQQLQAAKKKMRRDAEGLNKPELGSSEREPHTRRRGSLKTAGPLPSRDWNRHCDWQDGRNQETEQDWDHERKQMWDRDREQTGRVSVGPSGGIGPPRPPPRQPAAGLRDDTSGWGSAHGGGNDLNWREWDREQPGYERELRRRTGKGSSRSDRRELRKSPSPGRRSPGPDVDGGWDQRAALKRSGGGGVNLQKSEWSARGERAGNRDWERGRDHER